MYFAISLWQIFMSQSCRFDETWTVDHSLNFNTGNATLLQPFRSSHKTFFCSTSGLYLPKENTRLSLFRAHVFMTGATTWTDRIFAFRRCLISIAQTGNVLDPKKMRLWSLPKNDLHVPLGFVTQRLEATIPYNLQYITRSWCCSRRASAM